MSNEARASTEGKSGAEASTSRVELLADRLSNTVDTILGLGMIASVLLNFANVVARYVFRVAIVGADELLIYGMIATIFLGAVSVTWKDSHLRLDVLLDAMPASVQRLARQGAHFLLAVLCTTIGIVAATMAFEMAHFDQRSLAAGLPMVVPHGAVAVGMLLMASMAILRLFGFAPAAPADVGEIAS